MCVNVSRRRVADQSGFTLVELLVVMLILGILAAIAIPAFFSQRDKARDADAKAQINSAQLAMESCNTSNSTGTYVGCDLAKLQAIEPTIGTGIAVSGQSATGYTLVSTSATNNTFSVIRNGATITYPCSVPATGKANAGCPAAVGASGVWKS